MTQAVAIDGDIITETSTAKSSLDVDQKGKWQLTVLTVKLGEKISVAGKKVVMEAEATWEYLGASANNSPVQVPPEKIKLTAGDTKLTDFGNNVLVDGDEVSGLVDPANKIKVQVSQNSLKTD